MSEEIEAEIVGNHSTNTQALTIREAEPGKVSILRPAGSLDAIAEAFKEYQAVCERILTKDDYQLYEKKPRKKKSAWRKLATAFNVSTEKVAEDIQRQNGRVVSARYTIRAFTPTRRMEAEGFCEVHEKCCAAARGQKCHKVAWKGHYCCVKDCDGLKHWSHPEHDVISTAQTRATNRAIADLIGCGEVSAEELVDETAEQPKPASATEPIPKSTAAIPFPTEDSRKKMIDALKANPGEPNRDICEEYFRKLENPAQLMPNEPIEHLPLRFVPATIRQMRALLQKIAEFGDQGLPASAAFPAHPEPDKPAPEAKNPAVAQETGKDPLWWRNVIISVPPKGVKRDDYMRHPDTIGALYDIRHGNDDVAQAARQRLWGMCKWEPKPREYKGKIYEPTDADRKSYEALQAFAAWFAVNHPNEKL